MGELVPLLVILCMLALPNMTKNHDHENQLSCVKIKLYAYKLVYYEVILNGTWKGINNAL